MTLADAKKKIMNLVANRDHSAVELRQKLAGRFDDETVEEAVRWAQQQNWFSSPDVLKADLVEKLNRRGQGLAKINQKLADLGLSTASTTTENEYEKAKKLALGKWSPEDFQGLNFSETQKLKAKVVRFLASRGFESDIVSLIIKNELKAGDLFHDEEY